MKFWSVLLVGALALAHLDADAARRLGGGKSFGRQSSNVTHRESAPPAAPAAPVQQNAASAARPATPAPGAPAAAAPRRPWGAMLGGLAAGLGLAWLAHSLGLGAGFGQFLLIAVLALAAVAIVRLVLRGRRGTVQPAGGNGSPFAFQGASGGAPVASTPRQYSPDKVGNDASARPWETSAATFDAGTGAGSAAGSGVHIGSALPDSALTGTQSWGVPAGFDAAGFLTAAKRNFVTLQDAWDRSDIPTLRSMMTDGMLGEIQAQLSERENHLSGQPNKTDVVVVEAQLLGIEDLGGDYMASVEFTGMIREEPSAGPSPFREVWNMTKPKSGTSGWLVAGVQALQ